MTEIALDINPRHGSGNTSKTRYCFDYLKKVVPQEGWLHDCCSFIMYRGTPRMSISQ